MEMRAPEVVFGAILRGTAMAMVAENAYVPAGDFDQNRKTIEVINDRQLVGEGDKLIPSPKLAAIKFALNQSRTGQPCINWGLLVRSLLGLYSSVSESATYVVKTNCIGFSVAVEVKNGLALRGRGGRSPAAARRSCWSSSANSAEARTGAAPRARSRAAAPSAFRGGAR